MKDVGKSLANKRRLARAQQKHVGAVDGQGVEVGKEAEAEQEASMKLYYFPSPNPQKIHFALNELGLGCETNQIGGVLVRRHALAPVASLHTKTPPPAPRQVRRRLRPPESKHSPEALCHVLGLH